MNKIECYLEMVKKDELLKKTLHHESGKNSLEILELYIKESSDDAGNEHFSIWAVVKHSTMGALEHLPLNHIERFYK